MSVRIGPYSSKLKFSVLQFLAMAVVYISEISG